jgi:peptidoglycan/LPS O-acetylase OafA/YrhL
VAEALNLTLGGDTVHGLWTMYVVIAFLAQASIGGALLRSRMVATWIAWATILWSMGWLLILPAISPGDIYFPVLHHLAPLVIGIALLRRSPRHRTDVMLKAAQQPDGADPASRLFSLRAKLVS